jgi:hypothetical protein
MATDTLYNHRYQIAQALRRISADNTMLFAITDSGEFTAQEEVGSGHFFSGGVREQIAFRGQCGDGFVYERLLMHLDEGAPDAP